MVAEVLPDKGRRLRSRPPPRPRIAGTDSPGRRWL